MKIIQVIWLALMGGVIIFASIALIAFGGRPIVGVDPGILMFLGPVALVVMGTGLFMRRAVVERIPRDLPPEQREQRYLSTVVASLALIEGGGILLMMAGMIVGSPAWILVGAGAAVLLMVLARP